MDNSVRLDGGDHTARRIVELHGGAIRAESDGEGSRSIFTLPLVPPRPRG